MLRLVFGRRISDKFYFFVMNSSINCNFQGVDGPMGDTGLLGQQGSKVSIYKNKRPYTKQHP